ncbi:DUF305 domain-containing protein [Nonomuraea typhae]|uniref:DUF305 domain-containing protein n=1 Tax=Nonomuraea typhae TaxID=2603600 RepID=UPI0012FAC5CC|nr:DUF305 domain-containing protein [Nonomuraea typhae]
MTAKLPIVALCLAFTAACGQAAGAPVAAGAGYNPADLAFSQQMIPHHLQTIEVAELAEKKSGDAYVRRVARDLIKKERADVELMSSWLRSWGAAVPSTPPRSGHAMAGMLSSVQITELRRRSGAAFDTMWASLLARHLGSGVRMAESVTAEGEHVPTATLARGLIPEQRALIEELGRRADQE